MRSGSRADVPVEQRVLRRSLQLLRPHRGLTVGVLATGLGLTIAALLTPLLFGQAIDAVEAADEERIVWFGIATIAAGIAMAAFSSWSALLAGRLAVDVELNLRNDIFGHLIDLDRSFFERRKVGQLVSLILVTSGPIRSFLAFALPKLFSDLALFVFAAIAMAVRLHGRDRR